MGLVYASMRAGGGAAIFAAIGDAAPPSAPAVPTAVVGDAIDGTSATITWVGTGPNGSDVELETPPGAGNWTAAAGAANPTASGVQSFLATGLTAATDYRPRVRNRGATLNSAYTVGTDFGTDNVGGGGAIIPTPGETAPTLTGAIGIASNTTGTSYTATCPAATGAVTQYRYSLNGGSTWTTIAAGGRVANITGRTPQSTDTLLMAAGGAAGLWSASLTATVSLPAAPVAPPPSLPGGRVADPDITIDRGSWSLTAYRMRKQPREVKDVVIEMAPWFAGRADDPAAVTFSVSDAAITPTVTLVGTRINVAIAGGVDSGAYNISVRMSTSATPAIVREFDLFVDVEEVA